MDEAYVTARYLKQKFPNNPRMWAVIDYIRQNIQVPVDGLISGGQVIWLGGLTFLVRPAIYILGGRLCYSPQTIITLDPADPALPRIDSTVVNANWEVEVLKGVPSANPQKPTPDPGYQIELTHILIPAGATEPGGDLDEEIIYDENTEWAATGSGSAIDFDAVATPYHGSKHAVADALDDGDSFLFTAPAVRTFADYEMLSFFAKLPQAVSKSYWLDVQFFLGSAEASSIRILNLEGPANTWQNMAVEIALFQLYTPTFDRLRIRWRKKGPAIPYLGFSIDYVKLQKGIAQPIPGTDGKDGKSAYEIAVANGFVGTEVEWLASLKGSPGSDGDDGLTPYIGLNGNWYIGAVDTGIKAEGLDGDDGRTPEFRENAGWVEWRYVGDVSWVQLFEIPAGATDNAFDIYIDFLDTTVFVYNCPYAMKITQVISEGTAPALNPVLNTNLAQFDKLTITPAAVGLVILKGVLL